jgi:hypothetical protein
MAAMLKFHVQVLGKRTGYTVLTEEVNLGVCGWLGRWMKRED